MILVGSWSNYTGTTVFIGKFLYFIMFRAHQQIKIRNMWAFLQHYGLPQNIPPHWYGQGLNIALFSFLYQNRPSHPSLPILSLPLFPYPRKFVKYLHSTVHLMARWQYFYIELPTSCLMLPVSGNPSSPLSAAISLFKFMRYYRTLSLRPFYIPSIKHSSNFPRCNF